MVDEVLQRCEELFDLQEKTDSRSDGERRAETQKKKQNRNLVDDDFLFDPVALEVVVDVQDEDRKVVQVVEVQPEHTDFTLRLIICLSLYDQIITL